MAKAVNAVAGNARAAQSFSSPPASQSRNQRLLASIQFWAARFARGL